MKLDRNDTPGDGAAAYAGGYLRSWNPFMLPEQRRQWRWEWDCERSRALGIPAPIWPKLDPEDFGKSEIADVIGLLITIGVVSAFFAVMIWAAPR